MYGDQNGCIVRYKKVHCYLKRDLVVKVVHSVRNGCTVRWKKRTIVRVLQKNCTLIKMDAPINTQTLALAAKIQIRNKKLVHDDQKECTAKY